MCVCVYASGIKLPNSRGQELETPEPLNTWARHGPQMKLTHPGGHETVDPESVWSWISSRWGHRARIRNAVVKSLADRSKQLQREVQP